MADQSTKSIRRIVKSLKEDPTGLGAADELKSIPTSRGEGYINSRGDVSSSSNEGGEDKDEQPGTETPPTDDPGDNDTGGGGGINDGSDPGGSLGGDVADVVDELNTNDQTGTMTGVDPTTGNPLTINLGGIDGIEYNPPPGWDSPESEDGRAEIVEGAQNCASMGCPATVQAGARGATKWDQNSGYTYTIGYFKLSSSDTVPPAGFDVFINNCTAPCVANGDTGFFFPQLWRTSASTTEPPLVESDEWPSDGSCQIAYDHSEGGFKGHEKDPDCTAGQITPSQCIIVRSGVDANRYFQFCKLDNGGTKITEVDANGVAVPGTVIKTVDEGGRFEDIHDISTGAGLN
jgi:hypothetical protein